MGKKREKAAFQNQLNQINETKIIQELKILASGMELSNTSSLLQYPQQIFCILAIMSSQKEINQ